MSVNLKYVLFILGAALIIGICGIIALAVVGNGIPDVLQNVVVGSLTALAGLLVKADDHDDVGNLTADRVDTGTLVAKNVRSEDI